MNLALAIIFLWTGAMLLTVAFHPLGSTSTKPSAALEATEAIVARQTSAYTAT